MDLRTIVGEFLAVAGVVVIVVPVLLLNDSLLSVAVVLAGICMLALGVSRLSSRLLPDRRTFVGLRSEVEHFVRLVRRLNANALDGDGARISETKTEMHESVDRMAFLAGEGTSVDPPFARRPE